MIERRELEGDRKRAEAYDALARPVLPGDQDQADEGYREIRTESDVDGRVQMEEPGTAELVRQELEDLGLDDPVGAGEDARGEGDRA